MIELKRLLVGLAIFGLGSDLFGADNSAWEKMCKKARGQTVYWNAWGGEARINSYLQWASAEVEKRYGVEVRHVKLSDTAEAVTRVLAEKTAGKHEKGSVDVIWINGENFATMKKHGLLYGPFTEKLPNFRFVDTANKPTLNDFTVPVDGLEAPWSMAHFVFLYDTAQVSSPPRTPKALLDWAKANRGRFTYPQPPDFLGTTFLKQTLLSLTPRPEFSGPVSDDEFARIAAPLWEFLDALHPHLWRQGRSFPVNGPAHTRLLADGEIDISFAFSADAASNGILHGQLPKTVRTFVYDGGTLGNASFLAIPFNSSAKEGAMVLVNFLLSPEAQLRKMDPRELGSPTVLALERLSSDDRARFEKLPRGPATLSPQELGKPLAEPHPFWMQRLEKEWQKRYAAGQ
jgi:putative thiamine transport system substrate-binding protein